MKKRILSMFIAVLMVALMIPFSAITAFAADEMVIDTIALDIRPDIGSKRLTAAQIGYYDEDNATLAEYHKRIEIKGDITWTKDSQFGTEMGVDEVYETSKDYFISFKLGIKDEYKATTTFASNITNRIFGQDGTLNVQAMAVSSTEIQVVMKVKATVPKIVLNLPTPLANGEMTFADMAITNADTNGYYTVSQVDWHACNQFQLSTVTNKKSPTDKITHGIYSTRLEIRSSIAAVLETTPIEIQGFKNYYITQIDKGAYYTSIDITVDTRTPLEKLGVTVTEPKAGEISTAPIALEGTKITSYEWYFMDGDTFGPTMTASTKFLSGNKYRLRVTVEASEGYGKLATCIPVINGQKAETIVDFENGYNCYYDFTVAGEMEGLSAELLVEPKNGEQISIPTVVSDNLQLETLSWHRLNSESDEATTGNAVAIGSNFSFGKYRFVFILRPKDGYEILIEPNITIAGKNVTIEDYDDGFVRAHIDFDIALPVSVDAPLADQTPTAPTIDASNVSIESYEWRNSNNGELGAVLSNTDKFVVDKSYFLFITLKSSEEIFTSSSAVSVCINGKEAQLWYYLPDGKTAQYRIELKEHAHSYANNVVKYDDTHHWLECDAGEDCTNLAESIKDKAEHSASTPATCVTQAVCSCGQSYGSVDATNHAYGTLVAQDDPIHTATELKAGKVAHYHCGCGKYFTEAKAEVNEADLVIPAPTHSYTTANGYKEADGHANTCTCGAKDTVVAHTSSGSATETTPETCTVCGYVITPALGHTTHTPKTEWKSDANNHWHECTGCEGQQLDKAAHADTNNDEKCDTCGYDMPATGTEPGTEPGTDDPNTPDDSDKKDGLGAGAIIGIVVGVLVVLGGGGFALYWFVLRKKPILPTDPTTPVEEAPDTDVDADTDEDAEATDEDDSPETEDAAETEDKKDTE